jgi:O-antigen/teichoic acid export membrane protein
MNERAASRALLGKGSVYTVATAAQLLAALLAQPALTRLLDKPDYGRAALGVVVTQLVGMVVTAGLPAVVTREHFIRRNGPGAGTLVTMSVLVAVGLGGLVMLTGPLWAAPFGGFDAPMAVAALSGVAFAIIQSGQALQRARGEAGRFVIVAASNALGGQLLGVAIATWVLRSAVGYLAGVGIGMAAAAALCTLWARPSFRGITDRLAVRRWFAVALPTIPHLIAMYLMQAGDRGVITALRGDAANAAYTVAYLTGSLGIVLVNAANNAWAPLIYGAPEESRWSVLAGTTRDVLRLGAIGAVGIALGAPLGLAIIGDPGKYDLGPLVPVVAVTALATVAIVFYLSGVHVIFWTGRTKPLLWIAPVAVAVNLAAKSTVIALTGEEAGFVGVAVVTVLSYGLLAVLVQWSAGRLAAVPWRGRWWPVAFAAVGCAAGALLPGGGAVGWSTRGAGVAVVAALAIREVRMVVGWRRSGSGGDGSPAPVETATPR